jgi:hypothetical protein
LKPNGYNVSPSGDCERVTNTSGIPQRPDGYHRSPSGDCERVTSKEDDSTSSRLEDDCQESIGGTTSNDNGLSFPKPGEIKLSQSSRGAADCFKGTATLQLKEEIMRSKSIQDASSQLELFKRDAQKQGANYDLIQSTESVKAMLPDLMSAILSGTT